MVKYKFLGITLWRREAPELVRAMEMDYIELLLSAHRLHRSVFPPYQDVNRGRDVVLVAAGPSLRDFVPIENAVYLGVNGACRYDKVRFDYLFLQDFAGATPEYIETFCTYPGAKKFLGWEPYRLLPSSVIPDMYGSYPDVQRYYTGFPSIKRTFTYDIASAPLGDAHGSIVFPAMQFILWTHPRRIYLVGCDTNRGGYYAGKGQKNVLNTEKVYQGWVHMKQFVQCYYPDIEVISINPVGLKSLFRDEYQTPRA